MVPPTDHFKLRPYMFLLQMKLSGDSCYLLNVILSNLTKWNATQFVLAHLIIKLISNVKKQKSIQLIKFKASWRVICLMVVMK